MAAFEGVFLDFYGTLVGGDRAAVESVCQAVVDDHGLELSAAGLAERWGYVYFAAIESVNGSGFRRLEEIEHDTLVETVEPLAGRIDATPYIERLSAYLARPDLYEEVAEVLDTLTVPVCIVSNADERELRAAIAHTRLAIDQVVSSESAMSYKPEAQIFRAALAQTGWNPQRVIHVGDSLHSDVGGATRVGLRAAWLNRVDRIGDIGTEKPDFTWPDLRPLLALTNAGARSGSNR